MSIFYLHRRNIGPNEVLNGLIEIKITAIMDDETISGVLAPRAEAGDFD